MSDEILTPPDMLCSDCGRPYSQHSWDADVADEIRKRAEFDAGVAARIEEKLAFERLVQYKMAQARNPNQTTTLPPRLMGKRDPNLDDLERARIQAYEREKAYQQLVGQKVQAMKIARGDAEYIQDPAGPLPTPADRMKMFGPNAKKDAPFDDRFETRDA